MAGKCGEMDGIRWTDYANHVAEDSQQVGVRTITGARTMTQMFNPPHPGKVLREYLGDIDVTTAAKHLHVSRTTLSRILNGAAGISAVMSLRLSDALGTHASFWYDMQAGYDMWQASHKKRPKIERFDIAA
jgi:addiction module HigA family antidote